MPKVHVQKAAKDYPQYDIKKGDTYYSWSFYKGPKMMSKTRPRPSQLTNSKMGMAYAAAEALEDAIEAASCPGDITEALDNAASEIREVADEYQESADNIRDTFSESPTADDCEEKAEGLNEWADDIDSAKDDVEALNFSNFWTEGENDELREMAVEQLVESGLENPTDEQIERVMQEIDIDKIDFDDLPEIVRDRIMDEAKDLARAVTDSPL